MEGVVRKPLDVPMIGQSVGAPWTVEASMEAQQKPVVTDSSLMSVASVEALQGPCADEPGHGRAFEFFGGVPTRISYDNSKVAVGKIVGSREREVTKEFLRLKSHFLYEDHFCLVRRPNEKGHVERLLDFARRSFLVPVPRVESLGECSKRLE